jgi:cell division protein FtsZ
MARTSFVASPAKIKVIGLGGGGSNAVTRMVRENIQGVEFIAMNTDAQALAVCEAPMCVQLGPKLTKGLGAGGDHHIGHKAAEETRDELREVVSGSDMVFVTAGMGGGTGTGSISVVAEIAKQSGALTIAVVTKPFGFEGAHRMQNAEEGIEELIDKVDTLIIIPNDRLLTLCDHKTGVDSAFKLADDVLRHGVQAIAEVITTPGMINLDFADVKAIMKDAGPAWMSIGKGSGQNRAIDAAKEALASPLLDVSISGSKAVLFNVVGSSSLTLFEVNQAAEVIKQAVDPEANIIFGVANDGKNENEVTITLIATGFQAKLGMGSKANEEDAQLTNILKNMKTEEELDMPSFLRRPLFSRRRDMAPPSNTPSREPARPQRHFQ